MRLKDPFFRENWKTAIGMIPNVPFLMGENERGWKADVDWLLKPGTGVKIIEGKYGQKTQTPAQTVNIGRRVGPKSNL